MKKVTLEEAIKNCKKWHDEITVTYAYDSKRNITMEATLKGTFNVRSSAMMPTESFDNIEDALKAYEELGGRF